MNGRKVELLAVLAFVLAVVTAPAGTLLPDFLSASVETDFRSAYQSRGLIVEDRPVLIVPSSLDAALGPVGSLGVWSRTLTSLSDRKAAQRAEELYERDWGVRWFRDLPLADDVALRTEVNKAWLLFHGYHAPYRGRSDHAINEWRFRQELRHPLLSPYYFIRRSIRPGDTFYAQTGAHRPFALAEDVTLDVGGFVEMGDSRLLQLRYGARHDGNNWRSGIQSVNARLDLEWRLTPFFALAAGVHEFVTVNEPARRCVKARTTPWSRRDLTILSVAARFRF